ncbi:hypothetical protein [Desemzia sp. FAM 23990]|uniref:hypothetical protein n=1 Tax=Desemzia sp. FAM 23990 TaxID=3259520 RepID=UPI00388AA19B
MSEEFLAIEEERGRIMVTSLRNSGNGYTGHTIEISKQNLINKLIVSGVLEDGETIYFEEIRK